MLLIIDDDIEEAKQFERGKGRTKSFFMSANRHNAITTIEQVFKNSQIAKIQRRSKSKD